MGLENTHGRLTQVTACVSFDAALRDSPRNHATARSGKPRVYEWHDRCISGYVRNGRKVATNAADSDRNRKETQ